MQAVVIGASGFIGSHLVDGLLEAGHSVRAVVRHGPGLIPRQVLEASGLKLYTADMAEVEPLCHAMAGADVVFHLANGSLPQSSNRDPARDVQINLLGGLNVLEAARQVRAERLVLVSSGGTVYGVPNEVPIPEDHATNPICSYGITKLALEKYLALYEQLHGLKGLVLRVANPYGERQRLDSAQGVVPAFLSRALRNEPLEIWGDGSTIRDFLYISDVVQALLAVASYEGLERVFNVGSGQGTSLNELVRLLEEELGYSLAVRYKPPRGFDVPTNVLSIDATHRHLGWRPSVSVPEGLHRFHQSLRSS